MTTYRGIITNRAANGAANEWSATADDAPLPLCLDIVNHSPTGFAWGYGGSGPAQLAVAILSHATGDRHLALRLHQQFKWDVVAHWSMDGEWTLTRDEVLAWIASRKQRA